MPLIIETPRPADHWWYDPACAALVFSVMALAAWLVVSGFACGVIGLFSLLL